MTDPQRDADAAIVEQLGASIERLRQHIEARSDPALEEVAHALELLGELGSHGRPAAGNP